MVIANGLHRRARKGDPTEEGVFKGEFIAGEGEAIGGDNSVVNEGEFVFWKLAGNEFF